jgi:hypothetical protein
MFAGKAGAYPSEASFRCSTLGHWTGLERLARDKHSSLLRKFVNCGRKKFYRIWHRGILQNLLRNLLKVNFLVVILFVTFKVSF